MANVVKPLLYIHPKLNKSEFPTEDELTLGLEKLFNDHNSNIGNFYEDTGKFTEEAGWLGTYTCFCGEESSSEDYLITPSYATNSLCIHYLKWHRNEVPEEELRKVREILDSSGFD